MSLFLPNIPNAPDFLDFSQGQLKSNNQGLDTVFGIDHYKFSDATMNKGFHNTVTTPSFVTSPPVLPNVSPTTTVNPVLYGFEPLDGGGMPLTNLGNLQYSRGPSDAVPTPITFIQSPSAAQTINAGNTIPLFDFAGITVMAMANVYAVDFGASVANITTTIYWNGTTVTGSSSGVGKGFSVIGAGSVAQLKNTSAFNYTNTFYTIQFIRIQV